MSEVFPYLVAFAPASKAMMHRLSTLRPTAKAARTALRRGVRPRPSRPTKTRHKPIEDIRVGDLVWAWDCATGRLARRPVVRLFHHVDRSVLAVTVSGDDQVESRVESTVEHPFWVEGTGWVAACQLRPGDRLRRIDGGGRPTVAAVTRLAAHADVYNFEVAGLHNYFVGSAGVLVHNESSSPAFTGVYVDGRAFVPDAQTPTEVREFVERTQQHANYPSIDVLHRRAKAFLSYERAERTISQSVAASMSDPDSVQVKQAAHLMHAVRGMWSESGIDSATRDRIATQVQHGASDGPLGSQAVSELNPASNPLLTMFIRGEEGPLSIRDIRLMPDVAFATGVLARHAAEVRRQSPLLAAMDQFSKARRVGAVRDGKHFSTDSGADLRRDAGTAVRDELELPVMYGTSGSASDIASTAHYATGHFGLPFAALGVAHGAAVSATVDVIFDMMRNTIVPHAMENRYITLWAQHGGQADAFVEPFMRFSHSYPEIGQAVRMSLSGDLALDVEAIRRVTEVDVQRLRLAQGPTAAQVDAAK